MLLNERECEVVLSKDQCCFIEASIKSALKENKKRTHDNDSPIGAAEDIASSEQQAAIKGGDLNPRASFLKFLKACWKLLPSYVNKDTPEMCFFPEDSSFGYDDMMNTFSAKIKDILNGGNKETHLRYGSTNYELFTQKGTATDLVFFRTY